MSNKKYNIEIQKVVPQLKRRIGVQAQFFLQRGVLEKVELEKTAADKATWHIEAKETKDETISQLEEWIYSYLHGAPLPDLQVLYPPLAFTKRVLEELPLIPIGKTLSYKELANRLGRKNSFRAVAGACSRNLVPLVIPCHRVIASDGSLGGFSAGEGIKEELLALETAILEAL